LPSLLKPRRLPSASTTIVFTAPMRAAVGSTWSSNRITASLCGVVTLQPRNPSAASPRSAAGSRSGSTLQST